MKRKLKRNWKAVDREWLEIHGPKSLRSQLRWISHSECGADGEVELLDRPQTRRVPVKRRGG